MMSHKSYQIPTVVGVLSLALLAVVVGVSTSSSAQSAVSPIDSDAEATLLGTSDVSSVAMDCETVCVASTGDCDVQGARACGGVGSTCVCQWCEDRWDCYPAP